MTIATPIRPETVQDPALAAQPRLASLATIAEAMAPDRSPERSDFAALGDLLLDAILASDRVTLDGAVDRLRRLHTDYRRAARHLEGLEGTIARIDTLLALATGARDRVPSKADFALVAPGSRSHQVLEFVRARHSVRQQDIADDLGMAKEQVSRIASDLGEQRLVSRVKVGREVFVDITPHGQDVLDDIDARGRPATQQPASATSAGTTVLYANTSDEFRLDHVAVRAALERSGDPAGRSRALFVTLAATRPSAITERLLAWDALTKSARPEQIEIRLPSPDASHEALQDLTWDILADAGEPVGKARSLWPGPPPQWDGWAVLHGKKGRHGIVLVEAKSQPRELRSKPAKLGRKRDSVWTEVLHRTSDYVRAGERWEAWPQYADPAMRLAFVTRLQEVGIPVWWLNLYFLDPKRVFDWLPATRGAWLSNLTAAATELTIPRDEAIREYVLDEFIPVPEDSVLVGIA